MVFAKTRTHRAARTQTYVSRHCEERSDEAIQKPSFRGDAEHRTRNLEIPGLVLAHHPGMTEPEGRCAPRNDAQSPAFAGATNQVERATMPHSHRLQKFQASKN